MQRTQAAMESMLRFAADDVPPARPRYRRLGQPGRSLLGRVRPGVLAAIAAGGALGSSARYGVARLVGVGNGFVWATFAVNVSGSLALGFLLTLILERFPPSRLLRPFVATGFLGAFTTYSTFAVETDRLLTGGRAGLALAYAACSLVAGSLAVWAGMLAARAVAYTGRGPR